MDEQTGAPADQPTGLPAKIATSPTPVASFGIAKVRSGTADDFAAQVRTATERIRKDPGCEQYQVHRYVDEPDKFFFYERWASGADLVRHVLQPYMTTYVTGLTQLIDGEFPWTWITPITPENTRG